MNAAIEYISSGIIICLILGFAAQYATTMSYDRLNLIERNATLGKADRVADMVLLSPGYPTDWGMSYGNPQVLGLASESAMKLYNLDSHKVMRLSRSSTNYIPPVHVRDLIGLSSNYYLSLRIFPFFNLEVTNISNQVFSVTVLNQWNTPVSNVKIDAAFVSMPISSIEPMRSHSSWTTALKVQSGQAGVQTHKESVPSVSQVPRHH